MLETFQITTILKLDCDCYKFLSELVQKFLLGAFIEP